VWPLPRDWPWGVAANCVWWVGWHDAQLCDPTYAAAAVVFKNGDVERLSGGGAGGACGAVAVGSGDRDGAAEYHPIHTRPATARTTATPDSHCREWVVLSEAGCGSECDMLCWCALYNAARAIGGRSHRDVALGVSGSLALIRSIAVRHRRTRFRAAF
jgi:hypothetical protein